MDRWITDSTRSERLPYYTRANAGEVLPDPASPLGWTLVFEEGLLPGWLRGFEEFGIYRAGELPSDPPPVAGLFGGYFYINLSHMRLTALRMGMTVEAFDDALLGNTAVAPPYLPQPDDECPSCSAKVAETIGELLGRTSFPEIDDDLARVQRLRRQRPDLGVMAEAELVAHARSFASELDNAFARHDYSSLGSAVGPAMLGGLCAEIGAPELLLDLISGLGEVQSASPSWGLWRLSRLANASPDVAAAFDRGPNEVLAEVRGGRLPDFAAALEEFLLDYGMRGPNRWDIRAISWEAGPEQALALVDSLRATPDDNSPDARHDRLAAKRSAASERVRAALAGEDEKLATFETALRSTASTIPLREQTKAVAVTVINEVRMAIRELGLRGVEAGRFAAPEDVMMLLASELDDYVRAPDRFRDAIAERLAGYRELFALEPPFILDADPLPLGEWTRRERPRPAPVRDGEVLRGIGGSAGQYTGHARVVPDLAAAAALEPGEIMVAPLTDAAWTPLFLVAGAVVVDVGALNSHAVVVSRELGIPCVLSLNDATTRIPDGTELAVDGSAGTVTVLSTAPAAPAGTP